jgi:hypothetical protein
MSVALASIGTWKEQTDMASPYDAILTPMPSATADGDCILHVQCWKDTAAFSRDTLANALVGPHRRGGTTTTCLSTASTPDAGGMKAFQESFVVSANGPKNANTSHATSGGTGYGASLAINLALRGNSGRPVYHKYMVTSADTTTTNDVLATYPNFTTGAFAPVLKGDLIVIVAFQTNSTATLETPQLTKGSGDGWEFSDPVLRSTKVSAVGNKMVARVWTAHITEVGSGNFYLSMKAGSNATATGIIALSVFGTGMPHYVTEALNWNGYPAAATPGNSIASSFGGGSGTGVRAGDITFVSLFRRVASAITGTPAAWNLLRSTVIGGMQHEIWWFVHDGAAFNRSITWTTSCQYVWEAVHVRGCDPLNPVDSIQVGTVAVGTSAAFPAQTPTEPYCARLILGGWTGTVNGGNVSASNPLDPDAEIATANIVTAWTTEPKCSHAWYYVHDLGDAMPTLAAGNFTWPSNVTAAVASILLRPGPLLRLGGGMSLVMSPKYVQPEFWGVVDYIPPYTVPVTPPAAPVMAHTANGKFTITNYDPAVIYKITRVSGTGTASRVNNVVTISDATARWSIAASYAADTPSSDADFMERRPYTYHSENHSYACGSYSCNCRSDWGACGCACGGSGGNCGCYPSPNSQSWGQCGCPGNMCWYNQTTVCDTCTSYCDNWVQVKDATPPGYADAYGEWSKVS